MKRRQEKRKRREDERDRDTPHQHQPHTNTHRTPTLTAHTHHMHHTTQHNIGKEIETRLFLVSGGGAGPFERDLSLLNISRSDLALIATCMYMFMYM